MPDSANIVRALVAKLGADATLLALCPDNVFVDEAPPGAKRFVIVSLVSGLDEGKYGGRAYEDRLYSVVARGLSTVTTIANMNDAAARIDVLLEDQPLTASGYHWMTMHREEPVEATDPDEHDSTIRWYYRGGQYRVQMAVA